MYSVCGICLFVEHSMSNSVDFNSFPSIILSLMTQSESNPDPYVEVIWDFRFQFAVRHPDPYCFVTNNIPMTLGCQSK